MENTPLELYETAYRLHYVENRLPEAISYYEALIKEFPDSNECGYAVIQIQKIKANDISNALDRRKRAVHPLVFVSLIVAILSLAAAGTAGYYLYATQQKEIRRNALVHRAFVKMHAADYDEALKLIAEAKILSGHDITPFELAATIYKKKKQFGLAKAEYEIFQRLNPDLSIEVPTVAALTAEALAAEPQPVKPVNVDTAVEMADEVSMPPIEPPEPVRKAPVRKQVKQSSVKSQARPQVPKSPRLVHPDSISYF